MTEAGGSREQVVAQAFVSLADTLVDEYDVIDLLTRLVGYSIRLVGYSMRLLGADAGGILLADAHDALRVVAASNEDARLIELMQLQDDEGPCLDCYRQGMPIDVPDISATADRWPRFVTAVLGRPVFRAVHALPLRLRGQGIGALNLWNHQVGSLRPEELALGQALADVATIAILQERAVRRAEVLHEQLQGALNSRVIIEQAKGVLAQYGALPMDAAFHRMRSYARDNNQRLAEVARKLADRTLDPNAVLSPRRPADR